MADAVSLAGKWDYRSYLNQPDHRMFGGGIFTFETPTPTTLKGTLVMGSRLVLDLEGTITPATSGAPLSVAIRGFGRSGNDSDTDGWEYDYNGSLAFQWPAGVDQVPALVGSVLRAKPHDGGPAGVTASFIAVRLP
jgi:hypothetical protein